MECVYRPPTNRKYDHGSNILNENGSEVRMFLETTEAYGCTRTVWGAEEAWRVLEMEVGGSLGQMPTKGRLHEAHTGSGFMGGAEEPRQRTEKDVP